MSAESEMFIRSRPVYTPLAYDPKGRFNLLIGFGEGASALEDMAKNAGSALRAEDTVVIIAGNSSQQYDAQFFFNEKDYQRVEYMEHDQDILEALPAILKDMKMGLRVYIAGPEAVIWQAVHIAGENGVQEDEVSVEARGSFARRVTCTHCTATNENITTNIFECKGCGQTLFVYDHFSKRLAAYMGFRADAETPGELPEKVELYK